LLAGWLTADDSPEHQEMFAGCLIADDAWTHQELVVIVGWLTDRRCCPQT